MNVLHIFAEGGARRGPPVPGFRAKFAHFWRGGRGGRGALTITEPIFLIVVLPLPAHDPDDVEVGRLLDGQQLAGHQLHKLQVDPIGQL